MKIISETEFSLYNFTNDEETIKRINDWQFAEIQDKNGNRIMQIVISETSFLYRNKTKSEFYSKTVL